MAITQGQLTYDAEGNEGGPFHSRVLHVPSDSSGLTIGRGYDMKEKTSSGIEANLVDAGVDQADAALLSQAAGLSGATAKTFIVDNGLESFEISMEVQEALFGQTYETISKDVQRICNKPDCVAAYGPVDWDNLNDKIKDVMIDLRYRGDYNPASRKRIQSLVSKNDLAGFSEDLCNVELWSSVPKGRFQRRADFLTS